MIKDLQSSTTHPTGTEPEAELDESVHTERDTWIHEFRNALGNIMIGTSVVKSKLAEQRDTSASIRHIEEGCERCLRLLGTMPD